MTDPQQPTQEAREAVELLAPQLDPYLRDTRTAASLRELTIILAVALDRFAAQCVTATPLDDVREQARRIVDAYNIKPQRPYTDPEEELVEEIAAALQSERTTATDKARREGAEAMREAVAQSFERSLNQCRPGIPIVIDRAVLDEIRALPDPPQSPGDAAPEKE